MAAYSLIAKLFPVVTAVATLTVGVASAPTRDPDPRKPDYTVVTGVEEARPGHTFNVWVLDDIAGWRITGCEFTLGTAKPSECGETQQGWSAGLRMPYDTPPGEIGLVWQIWYVVDDEIDVARGLSVYVPPTETPHPDPTEKLFDETGKRALRVLPPFTPEFTVTPDRSTARPGESINLTFATTTPDVRIDACQAQVAGSSAACTDEPAAKRTVSVRIPPADTSTTAELTLTWRLIYSSETEDERRDSGGEIVIGLLLDPPEFAVRVLPETVRPGSSVTIEFASLTNGVAITGCGVGSGLVTRRDVVECVDSPSVVVPVPWDARPGSTETLSWFLRYTSTRPREDNGDRDGQLAVRVEILPPSFAVIVEPASGPPGQEVTATFRALDDDVDVVNCVVWFPGRRGGRMPAVEAALAGPDNGARERASGRAAASLGSRLAHRRRPRRLDERRHHLRRPGGDGQGVAGDHGRGGRGHVDRSVTAFRSGHRTGVGDARRARRRRRDATR